VLLVSAWFRKYPAERARALTPEQALTLCRYIEPGSIPVKVTPAIP
jgi:hypothetical protein